MMLKLSIVIPIYNEEETIEELHRRLNVALKQNFSKFSSEFIFIDDGSTDRSFKILLHLHDKDKRVKILQLSRNFGHHNALTAGLDFAYGDFVVLMDGDLQDQPEEIITLYRKIAEGYDVVYGIRKDKQFGFVKRFLSATFVFALNAFSREKIQLNSSIFRVLKKDVVEGVRSVREHDRYILGIIGWVGFKHCGVEVKHGKRYSGKSKYSLRKQFRLAFNALFSYGKNPFPIFFIVLLLFTGASILFFLILPHFVSLATNIYFLFIFLFCCLQLFIVIFIGEYVWRSYMQGKNRPLYILKTKLL